MTAVQTLREPKAKRSTDGFALKNRTEIDKPETAQDRYLRWCRECDGRREQRIRAGELNEEDEITEEEIVAICKEARAERYAEEQRQKNAAGG